MSFSKKGRFDPAAERSRLKNARSIATQLQEISKQFWKVTCEAVTSAASSRDPESPLRQVLSFCDPLTAEILFVSLLGLHGVECLRMAVKLLPEKLDRGDKWTYVKRILDVGGVLPSRSDSAPIKTSTLMHISESLMQTTYFEQRVSFDTFSPLLNAVSSTTGIAHMAFLTPPVTSCINEKCSYYGQTRSLCISHNPTTVTVFKLTGAVAGTKICYKCWKCETNYNYAMYGNKTKDGECFYDAARDLVEISDTVYCEKQLYLLYCQLSMHCWVSFSGFAEVYFDWTHDSMSTSTLRDFVTKHKKACPLELSRKHVSLMFFKREVEQELRETPQMLTTFRFKSDSDFEKYLSVEDKHCLYPHEQQQSCKVKGCGSCWVADGLWKLRFMHCMFPVVTEVPGIQGVNFPDVCPEQPHKSTIFCAQHLAVALNKGYPTDLKGFITFCGSKPDNETDGMDGDDVEYATDKAVVDSITQSTSIDLVSKSQGTLDFLKHHPEMLQHCQVAASTTCEKDTGESRKSTLRHWSRGHVLIVRTCGHIDTFRPIYKSESPSQVLMIMLSWLIDVLKHVPAAKWSEIVLSYDAMCKIDAMNVVKRPLPLPAPYDTMWSSITKVIDELHIKNHKDERCKTMYDSKALKDKYPEVHFMSAEQTFAWLARFKRILCAMPKHHHLFYLHRLIKRRNRYTERCQKLLRQPLLPKTIGH